jgi:hypothetical protein
MSEPRVPDLFICGFTKCATSSLHDWLVQHPGISGGFQKELEYLYDKESYFFTPERNIHVQGLKGYAALFATAPEGTLWLDATPAYAHHNTARQTIADLPGRPPVIFVTRDPVDQIASTYHYFSNNKLYIDRDINIETFFEMVLDGRATVAFEQDHLKNALDWACFGYWLALWQRDVGMDRVVHLDMRTILKDPDSATRAVFDRLGLPPCEGIDFSASNETYFVKSRALQQVNATLRRLLPRGKLYDQARALYRRLNATTVKPEVSTREQDLRKLLAAQVAKRNAELLLTLQS